MIVQSGNDDSLLNNDKMFQAATEDINHQTILAVKGCIEKINQSLDCC